jgi:hypothetical protein
VSLPSDPADAVKWAFNHVDSVWWIWGAIAVGIAWTNKRLRDWNRRNADPTVLAARAKARAALIAALSPAVAAAGGRVAAPPSPAPAAPAAPTAAGAGRKHRHPAQAPTPPPPQRSVTPVARSVDVPAAAAAATGTWTLAGAFGDPAHARTAIVIAEALGPPLALR